MYKTQFRNANARTLHHRFILTIIVLVLSLTLSTCVVDNTKISTHMEMTILKSYLNNVVLPNDPDARLEDMNYYQFLRRYRDGNHQVYVFAWDVYDDTSEWSFTINDQTFVFTHEINFIVYRSSLDIFLSVEEAINQGLFSIKDFEEAIKRLDLYILAN